MDRLCNHSQEDAGKKVRYVVVSVVVALVDLALVVVVVVVVYGKAALVVVIVSTLRALGCEYLEVIWVKFWSISWLRHGPKSSCKIVEIYCKK